MFFGTRNRMVTFSKVSSKQGCQNQPGSVARLQFFSLKSSKNEYQLLKSVPFRFFRTIKLLVPFLKAIDKQGCQILLTGLPDPHFSPKNAKNWSNLQKKCSKKVFWGEKFIAGIFEGDRQAGLPDFAWQYCQITLFPQKINKNDISRPNMYRIGFFLDKKIYY